MTPELWSPAQLAELLGTTERSARRDLANGRIPGRFMYGNRVYVYAPSVWNWIAAEATD